MARIPAKNSRDGIYAEHAFRSWLIESKLGFLVVDQTPMSMPPYLFSIVKRPDFLVGILSVGMIAVDVKARTPVLDGFVTIEIDEYDSFCAFERYFGMPVWYACYLSRDYKTCLLFRNSDIRPDRDRTRIKERPVLVIPIDLMTRAPYDEPFDMTLFRASRERLA